MSDDFSDFEDEESDSLTISELLDSAYEVLNDFANWCETVCDLDARTIEQDSFNVETLLDYLANYHRKSLESANEYELRWFLFSHYIRKSSAEPDIEERLLRSVIRFVSYLEDRRSFTVHDWMSGVLDEAAYFQRRLATYRALSDEDEAAWKSGFMEWCAELDQDLDARCLLLPSDLGGGLTWSENMGWREATLRFDANNRWQIERDELIESGMGFEQIKDHLTISYLEWVDSPQDRLDGRSPTDIILAERMEAPDETEDETQVGDWG